MNFEFRFSLLKPYLQKTAEDACDHKLVYRRVKRKRNKASQFMLLPALIFIGAARYLVDSRSGDPEKMRKAKLKRKSKADPVTLIPAIYEAEPQEIINR